MSGDWDYYMCLIDDVMASIFLDMERIESAPDQALPWLLSLELTMQAPREDGLSSQQEADALYTIEDELIEALDAALEHHYVGRLTFAGRRVLYSYVAQDASTEALLKALIPRHPEYELRYELRQDPQWLHYTQWLYPGERERAEMSNRRVVLKLKEYGDQLTVPRQVEHLILFATRARAESFMTEMGEHGFQGMIEPQQQDDGAWAVQLHRVDPVELEHINEIVHTLSARAVLHDGIYDGWGCMVVSEEPPADS